VRDIAPFDYAALRRTFGGPWMVNNGYDRAMALQAVASGAADLVAFGRPFIGNPDLGRRLREDLPWAPSDRKTYYGGAAAGYTDYAGFEASECHGAEGGAGSPSGAAAPA
jgi:N-ethylmaleimide reductase